MEKKKFFNNKTKPKKIENTFMTKNFLLVVISIVLVVLATFLFLALTYKEVFIIDVDGYMLSNETIESLMDTDDETSGQKISVVKLKSNDSIYKNAFDHYVNDDKDKTVNVSYPLFVDNGFAIINYNGNVNLLNDKFERVVGYENLVLSYGHIYDGNDYTQVDQENYLFLSYQDGIFINLYDIKIETVTNTYTIPTNSFLFFFENKLNYFERGEEGFVRRSIIDLDKNSKFTFYYEGLKEKHEYLYEQVFTGIGNTYVEFEMPDFSDIDSGEQNTGLDTEGIDGNGTAQPEEGTGTGEAGWQKPTVSTTNLKANVYSIEGTLYINDPSGAIVSAPTFTIYKDNKIYSRRTFYSGGNFVLSGLSSVTEYFVIGQYTYLDSDMETKKLVTFYSGNLTTNDRSSLGKVSLTHKLGDIYSKKIVLNEVGITGSLQSEVLRGVQKVQIKINGEYYPVSTSLVQSMLNGSKVTLETSESLESNSEQEYEIVFYDRDGYELVASNNTGVTRTSKEEPSVLLKQLDSDNLHTKIQVELRNKDNADITDYKYLVVDSAGEVVASEVITDTKFTVSDLDPNQLFTIKVTGDVDLDNGKGVVDDYLLGEMGISTLPISNLGFVNLTASKDVITSSSASIAVSINQDKTDAMLLQILKEIRVSIYDADTNDFVETKTISGDEIDSLKANKSQVVTFDELDSNKVYKVKFSSLVKQGRTEMELDCVYNLEEFKTRKKTAQALIINSFVTNNMIDYDVLIDDKDGAILSAKAVIELRDEDQNIINTQVIDTNADDYIRITYNDLLEKHNYNLYIYANEYNETDINSEYVSKYDLLQLTIYTDGGISGNIELVSSVRASSGTNLVDVESGGKWMQTLHQYNMPSSIDEDGNMHIYSKNGSSAYAYDLSEYYGQMVTATFKVKAVTSVTNNYKLYFGNDISGTTDSSRSIELDGVSTDTWKSFTYTFVVGEEVINSTTYGHVSEKTFGKNNASYVGFYITGGTAKLAEYVISDFQVASVSEYSEFTYDKSVQNKSWDSNKNTTATSKVVSSNLITLESGYYYDIRTNSDYINVLIWKKDGSFVKETGDISKALTMYASEEYEIAIQMIDAVTNMGQPDISADEVEFTIKKYKKGSEPTYSNYKYSLDTKVRVDLVDIRSEITNRDYFIKVYENDVEVKSYNYVELEGVTEIRDVIKSIELEENKNYKVELGIKIRDRYYALSSFEISTGNEVIGISTIEEWSRIQPYGNYIVLNDLDFKGYNEQTWSYGNRYFYGSIDFQGYAANIYTSDDTFQRIGRLEKSASLKNLVLNVYLDQTSDTNLENGFIDTNYGLIENVNVNVYDLTDGSYKVSEFAGLCNINQRSGIIRNFVVNIPEDVYLYSDSGILVRNNYGLIENGYVYGEGSLVLSPEVTSGEARDVSFIQKYGGSKSTVDKVFVLTSMKFLDNSKEWATGGLISYESYGKITNSYVTGVVNTSKLTNGPAVYATLGNFSSSKLYYLSDYTYTNDYHQRVNATALNDVTFQKSLLDGAFTVDEMVVLGYYPQVIYSSNKMPKQIYLKLPEVVEDNLVDIISSEIVEQTNDSAVVEFNVSNPEGEEIIEIVIADLDVEILEQSYADGKSKVKVNLTNPVNYVSKYQIRSIKSKFLDYESERKYATNEKYVEVSFYKEISTVNDWMMINEGLNQNYAIMNDIDFYGYNNIPVGNFTGKIEGNNFTLSNIEIISYDGVFNQMNGILQNISFENITKYTESSMAGIAGYSNKNARYDNVHVKNILIEASSDKSTDNFFAGGLVGQLSGGMISNSSVTNVTITSDIEIGNVSLGGLVGYSTGASIVNSYAQDVNLGATNSVSTYGVGGLVGRESSITGTIENCYTTGNVSNDNYYTGGIVGYGVGVIEKTYSAVNVSGEFDYVGGISGRSEESSSLINNLYVGNIYSSKNYVGRITPSITANKTNYAYSDGLVNGVISNINNGEVMVSYEQLLISDIYKDTIGLGEGFDYSKSSDGILPKLYYADTEELLPNQNDNSLYKDKFTITNVIIDEKDDYADITISFENPDNYLITGLEIENMDVEIISSNNDLGISTVEFKATPTVYVDSYKLKRILYKESEEDSKSKKFDKSYKLDVTFYRQINSYDDWQNISTEVAENYLLMSDIDFTNKTDVNTGVVFNRLETNDDGVHTLKGIKLAVVDNQDGFSIINRVDTSIKNIGFEVVSIVDTTTKSNDYVNVIGNIYGSVENVSFKNVTIDAPNEDYVSIVGGSYGSSTNGVSLTDITITGREYVAGYVSVLENSLGKIYTNVSGTNLIITASKGYVGGLVAEMTNKNTDKSYYITQFSVSDSFVTGEENYVGGIVGIGEVSNSTVSNTEVTGGAYVGGLVGYQNSSYMTGNKVDTCTVVGSMYYIGGATGRSLGQEMTVVKDSIVKSKNSSTYGVGGLTGLLEGYTVSLNGIINTTVTGTGFANGGLVGRQINGTVSDSYVEDGTINGNKYIGGAVGEIVLGEVSSVHITRTLINAIGEYAGGIIGFMDNVVDLSGQINEVYVTDTDVVSDIYAGGFIGGANYKISDASNNSYGLYFEGSVTSNNGGGLGSGDEFNDDILGLSRVYAYEGAVVNGEKISSLAGNGTVTDISSDITLNNGMIIDETTGNSISHYLYPYGAYTNYVELEANKTYEVSVSIKGGSDWMRIYFYKSDGTYISPSDSGDSYLYAGEYFDLTGIKTIKFKVQKDCKMRLMLMNTTEVSSYAVNEVGTGSGDLTSEQVLNYQDLRNKITWTRYYDSSMYDFLYLTKLNYKYSGYDWSQLQYSLGQFNVTDLSGNGNGGVAKVEGINADGVTFDGVNGEISISNYQLTDEVSISTNVTQYKSSSPYYQFIFSSVDSNNNGIGVFIHNRQVYVRINSVNYVSGYIPLYEEVYITATYDGTNLKVYINGELRSEHVVNQSIASGDVVTMISPAYNDGIANRRFVGAMRNITVFDRALDKEEVMNNYSLDSVTNSDGLKIYYDFGDMKYESGVGNYPTKKDSSASIVYDEQTPTELPTEENRSYSNNVATNDIAVNLLSSKLDDIYKVYASGVNTINLEFDEVYDDVSFSYKYGTVESELVKVEKRVYSLSYDFKSALEIVLRSASGQKTVKFTADELVRKLYVDGDKYYHINDQILYVNGQKVLGNVVNVYDGLVLTNDYKVYDISSKNVLNSILQEGILSKEVSLYESNVDGTTIKAYYNFSKVIDGNGNVQLRDGQLLVRDGQMYVFSSSDSVKQEMNLFNMYNTTDYQVSLMNGSLVVLKNKLKYPGYFNNSEIVEVSFDKTSAQTVMLIRYSNDYVYAFDYYTGDELYSYGTKLSTSLFKFIFDGFSNDDNLASSNDSYGESKSLLGELDKLTNQEVIDKLNPGSENGSSNEIQEKPITGSNQGTSYSSDEVVEQYIQVYNYDTDSYEVYSVSELLDSEKEKVTSETAKINNDTFLYNYFYNKTNTLDNVVKIIIYVVIIGLVLVNLIVFARYLSRKEVKNNG